MKAPQVTAVALARDSYAALWDPQATGISARTRAAQAITIHWQQLLLEVPSGRYEVEVPVAENLRERIDAIDMRERTAFEMKVSRNNPQHEFFKDVFKVREFNRLNSLKLARMVFIAPQAAISRIRGGIGGSLSDDSAGIGFLVSFEALD